MEKETLLAAAGRSAAEGEATRGEQIRNKGFGTRVVIESPVSLQ
jgi:hypothetical protein